MERRCSTIRLRGLLAQGLLTPRRRPAFPRKRRCEPSWQTVVVDDEELLARAEQSLTEIKVSQGLSEHHAAVLAALRIRLKGSEGKSLDEMLEAADDPSPNSLEEKSAEAGRTPKPSLDDLLAKEPKPKQDWPS